MCGRAKTERARGPVALVSRGILEGYGGWKVLGLSVRGTGVFGWSMRWRGSDEILL
jgi:hypothetical protein